MKEIKSKIVFTETRIRHSPVSVFFGEVEKDFLATNIDKTPIAGTLKSSLGVLGELEDNKEYEIIIKEK